MEVSETRVLQKANDVLPLLVRIAKDRELTCILGAWLGNKVNDANPWLRTIDKLTKALNIWKAYGPSLPAKARIIQCVVGGGTQYLMTVQGMPKHTEKAIQKIIRSLI